MKTENKTPLPLFHVSLIFLLSSLAQFCHGVHIIRQGQTIKDGDTLLSENGNFELGFFSPENSTSRFVGIWYKIDVQTITWTANRDKPISDRNGILRIGIDGNLVVLDGNRPVWSSNVPVLSNNTAAVLENSGNFILSNNDTDTGLVHWESFNHPTDTFLPEMRLPVNSAIGENKIFTSWKSENDPSPGNYTVGIDPTGGLQIVIRDRTRRIWRSGQWDSMIFTGVVNMSNNARFTYGFNLSPPDENKTRYFTYKPSNDSDLLRFRIGWNGTEQQLRWDDSRKKWTVLLSQPDPDNKCDLYNYCGNYATCDNFVSHATCECLEGFSPKFSDLWSRRNWSGGCERRVELQCPRTNNGTGPPDGFKRLKCTKLPDLSNLWLSATNEDDCRRYCSGNCSCTAYAYVYGIGCMIWTGDLVDVQHMVQNGRFQFFYRLHHSEFGIFDPLNLLFPNFFGLQSLDHVVDDMILALTPLNFTSGVHGRISKLVIIIISLVGACFLVVSLWLLWRYKNKLKGMKLYLFIFQVFMSDV